MIFRHHFSPFTIEGVRYWHHWIVSEFPIAGRAIGSETRVAYQTLNSNSEQVPTTETMWSLAQTAAKWQLAPREVAAFRNLTCPKEEIAQ